MLNFHPQALSLTPVLQERMKNFLPRKGITSTLPAKPRRRNPSEALAFSSHCCDYRREAPAPPSSLSSLSSPVTVVNRLKMSCIFFMIRKPVICKAHA